MPVIVALYEPKCTSLFPGNSWWRQYCGCVGAAQIRVSPSAFFANIPRFRGFGAQRRPGSQTFGRPITEPPLRQSQQEIRFTRPALLFVEGRIREKLMLYCLDGPLSPLVHAMMLITLILISLFNDRFASSLSSPFATIFFFSQSLPSVLDHGTSEGALSPVPPRPHPLARAPIVRSESDLSAAWDFD